MRKILSYSAYITLAYFLTGCANNPVTNTSELHLLSQNKEIALGESHYPTAIQMGQGKYLQDAQLTEYIKSVGLNLAQHSDRPDLPYEFVILNDSVPNAWALPGGKIAINRGLLVHLDSEAELAAVLAHEITHATARHGAKSMERQLVMLAGLGTLQAVLSAKSENQTASELAILSASATAALVGLKYGRDAEREADHYGIQYMVKAGYDPMAAVGLQQTFVKLMDQKEPNWLKGLLASHPPSQERAKTNYEFAQTFPQQSLKIGHEIYHKKLFKLKKQQLAYNEFDKASSALQKKNYTLALELVQKAQTQLPTEALFFGLKGDILTAQKKYRLATNAYTQALKYDNQYYKYYYQRGMAFKQLGQLHKAESDLKQAYKYLPDDSIKQALTALNNTESKTS